MKEIFARNNWIKAAILFLLFLLCFNAEAQTEIGFSFGPCNASWINPDGNYEYVSDYTIVKKSFGISPSIFADLKLIENLSFRPTIGYVKKGLNSSAYYSNETLDFQYNRSISTHNIEFSTLIKAQYVLKRLEIYGLLGPGLGISVFGMIEENYKVVYFGSVLDSQKSRKYLNFAAEGMKRTEMILNTGAGISVDLDGFKILAQFDYCRGMTDIDEAKEVAVFNSYYRVLVGTSIPISKRE